MAETEGKHVENSDPDKLRGALFSKLDAVLRVAEEKFRAETKADASRRSWGRLIVQTVVAYAKVLETAELEKLNERVEALEEKVDEKQ